MNGCSRNWESQSSLVITSPRQGVGEISDFSQLHLLLLLTEAWWEEETSSSDQKCESGVREYLLSMDIRVQAKLPN